MGDATTMDMLLKGAGGEAPRATATAVPRRWWQWFLLYPAAAGALFTAVPEAVDKGLAAWHGLRSGSYSASERQRALWSKNITCLEQASVWHSNPSNVRVNATVCPSGDVLIRASSPNNQAGVAWVELNEILGQAASASLIPQARATTSIAGLGSLRRAPAQSRDPRLYAAAYQQMSGVVCQRFLDQRRLLRHVRTPQGCFDEIIDTLNGAVIQSVRVPCRGGC